MDNLVADSIDNGVLTILIPTLFIDKYFPAMRQRKITQQLVSRHQASQGSTEILAAADTLMLLAAEEPSELTNAKIICATLQLLIGYYENFSVVSSEEKKRGLITNLISYLHDNANKALTLADLAQTFFLSEGYLSRYFKKNTGLTIFQYLESIRAFQAFELLKDGTKTVEEIALEVGFVDSKALNKAMKKYYGKTAKSLRTSP